MERWTCEYSKSVVRSLFLYFYYNQALRSAAFLQKLIISLINCLREMFVEVLYKEGREQDELSAPLAKIQPIDADDATKEAIADWHYWLNMGYEFVEE